MWAEERLQRVVATILKLPVESVGPDTNQDTVRGWDSLKHMNLILALEEEFGVTIPDEEITLLTSYPLVRIVILALLGLASPQGAAIVRTNPPAGF